MLAFSLIPTEKKEPQEPFLSGNYVLWPYKKTCILSKEIKSLMYFNLHYYILCYLLIC